MLGPFLQTVLMVMIAVITGVVVLLGFMAGEVTRIYRGGRSPLLLWAVVAFLLGLGLSFLLGSLPLAFLAFLVWFVAIEVIDQLGPPQGGGGPSLQDFLRRF